MHTLSRHSALGMPKPKSGQAAADSRKRNRRPKRNKLITIETAAIVCALVALVFLLLTTLLTYFHLDSSLVDRHDVISALTNLGDAAHAGVDENHGNNIVNNDAIVADYTKPWSRPLIHVMNTRFMQDQGSLVHLGRARLALFKSVCLPSVVGQTIMSNNWEDGVDDPPLLWIIKIDPDLDETLKNEMIELLNPYSNFYVVGSNTNFGVGVGEGSWRSGEVGNELIQNMENGRIYTGDLAILQRAHHFRDNRSVLETRLDADDGLHIRYLEAIQSNAIASFIRSPTEETKTKTAKWKYWCAKQHLEWNPAISATNNKSEASIGSFAPFASPHLCITPGLTVGFRVGTEGSSVPRYPHDKIVQTISQKGGCGLKYKSCYQMIDNPQISAIRSRTPTSAGMKDVIRKKDEVDKLKSVSARFADSDALYATLKSQFGIHKETILFAATFIRDNTLLMAEDNIEGQCTHGHSCKVKNKDALQRIIDLAGNGRVNGVETIEIEDV